MRIQLGARLWPLGVLLLFGVSPVAAREACEFTQSKDWDAFTLVVDANTGQRISGGAQFPQGSQITVIVTRKNPFKYTYRVETVVTPLEEAIALAFLRMIPGLPEVADAGTKAAASAAPAAPECMGEAAAAWSRLEASAAALTNERDDLQRRAQEAALIIKRLNEFRDGTDKDRLWDAAGADANAACISLVNEARGLSTDLPKVIDLPAVAKVEASSKKVTAARIEFDTALAALKELSPAGHSKCSAGVTQRVQAIEAVQASIPSIVDTIKKLEAAKADFVAAKKLLDSVLADDSAFEEIHRPFVPDSPTNVQVTVYRRNLRRENAKEQQVVSIPIHVGRSRLSISAGFGFSTIGNAEISRQSGKVPDGSGGTKTGSVFGLEESSSFRPTVAVLLNATLCSTKTPHGLGRVGLAASSGIVTTGTGDGRRVDFLLGGSLTLLDDQLFVTVAFHAGEVKELAGGYAIGDPIPADLNDPLPTTKRWAKGLFVGASYRIR